MAYSVGVGDVLVDGAHENDGNGAPPLGALDVEADLEAVLARQEDVDEHHVRAVLVERQDAVGTGLGEEDPVAVRREEIEEHRGRSPDRPPPPGSSCEGAAPGLAVTRIRFDVARRPGTRRGPQGATRIHRSQLSHRTPLPTTRRRRRRNTGPPTSAVTGADGKGGVDVRLEEADEQIARDQRGPAAERGRREEQAEIRADHAAQGLRDDEAHEADEPRDADDRADHRRAREEGAALEGANVDAQALRGLVAERQDVHPRGVGEEDGETDGDVARHEGELAPRGDVEKAHEPPHERTACVPARRWPRGA